MTITIEEVVQKIDDWRNKQVEIQEMTGGMTNKNFKAIVDGRPFFVRVPGASTELLAIDRDNEYHSSKAFRILSSQKITYPGLREDFQKMLLRYMRSARIKHQLNLFGY